MKQTLDNTTVTLDGQIIVLEGKKACPKCKRKRDMTQFGFRRMKPRGVIRPQSQCIPCRGKATMRSHR